LSALQSLQSAELADLERVGKLMKFLKFSILLVGFTAVMHMWLRYHNLETIVDVDPSILAPLMDVESYYASAALPTVVESNALICSSEAEFNYTDRLELRATSDHPMSSTMNVKAPSEVIASSAADY
jgi:hypothetical protein